MVAPSPAAATPVTSVFLLILQHLFQKSAYHSTLIYDWCNQLLPWLNYDDASLQFPVFLKRKTKASTKNKPVWDGLLVNVASSSTV